jgi:hypothetical protein
VSDRDGDRDIFVMDADGGNVRQLTDDPEDDGYPAWSPVLQAELPTSLAPTPTPRPTPSVPLQFAWWMEVFDEFMTLKNAAVAASNELQDRVRESGSIPSAFIDEFRKELEQWRTGLTCPQSLYQGLC